MAGFALALAMLSLTWPVGAQPTGDTQEVDGRLRAIHVVMAGSASPSSFGERLAAWFTPEVRVNLQAAPHIDAHRILGPKDENGVYVWIEVRSIAAARIYFVVSGQGPTQRFLLRDIELENGLDELGLERLTQVVYASVLALWQGRVESRQSDVERELSSIPEREEPSIQRPPSARPAPPASAPRRASRSGFLSFTVLGGYGFNARGRERPAHGPEVRAALATGSVKTRFGGYWSGRYLLPVRATSAGVTLRLTGGRLCVGALLERVVSRAFRVEVGAGFGGDVVQYGVVKTSASLERASGDTEFRPLGSWVLGARFVVGTATIALLGELDVQLQRNHYDVRPVAGPDRPIIEPWRVQPGFSLLVGFDTPPP